MYDTQKAYEAQVEHCKSISAPVFAPGKRDPTCYRCRQNIFAESGHPIAARLPHGRVRLDYTQSIPGISVEKASQELICGCPFCNASFDD